MGEIFQTYKGIRIKGYAVPSPCGQRFLPAVVLSKRNGHRYNEFKASARQLVVAEREVATNLAMQYGEDLVDAIVKGVEPEKLL